MRKLLALSVICLTCVFSTVSFSTVSQAQTKSAAGPNLSGEISYEESTPVKNQYVQVQDETISYFENLQEHMQRQMRAEGSGNVPALSDAQLNFLGAAYLYCAINFGECPLLLDAVLEVDVINSRLNAQASCPLMTKFWKFWVRNDFENRHKYSVKTGFLKTTSDFNQNKRIAYLKCQGTVESEIAASKSNQAFFSARYHQDAPKNLVATKAIKFLKDLKAKVPNVFVAVGARAN